MKFFKKKYNHYSDQDLVKLIAKGNEAAFDEVYHRYAEQLYRYFYKLLYQDEELAADFCQTLFIKLYEKAYSFDPQQKFSTWLYAIASNMCKNEYRRQSRANTIIPLKKEIKKLDPQGPLNIDRDIFNQHLQIAINKLDDKHRFCFILRFQEEKSIAEISKVLSCPKGTVKSRLHNALKRIAIDLEQFNPKKKKVSNE